MSFPVDFGSRHTSSVEGISYQKGLVLRILDFPLCKYESCTQKVTAIINLSSTLLCLLSDLLLLSPELLSTTMDHRGESQEGAVGLKHEELPQMDGSCDACEPDEAQPATHMCHSCSFAFCPVHAEKHSSSTHHPLMPYDSEKTQANGLGSNRDSRAGDGAEDEAGVVRREEVENGLQLEAESGGGAEGAEAGQEAIAAGEAGKRDTVTVERLRCKEHGQEGSLYCRLDEKIICVVCAVQGEHREHEVITLHEAYVWQKVSLTLRSWQV